ncbi:hypothetical protein Poly24_31220 [Rosistilla carotiformis]|uniref:Sulfatase n=1 Tax=Rosistilla carotiformis TaxID=2528017 RepID=A0A518JV53_9BACT|nr:DUF1501 domain-containing protein [Rosistilla carotiformis]QDV69406.1 hypothetical protein Poly24_31220 [Rosistilla carotiformis]
MFANSSHHDVASRRRWLQACSSGFGMLALSSLQQQATAASKVPLVNPKAKSVILCYMSGGVSHVDSFDPKPQLVKDHGKSMPVKVERTQFNNNGKIFGSPFTFKPHGESGLEISEIFPEIGSCADHLAVVRSATTNVNEHAQGNFAIHTGFPFLGHPSAGAWISYGLGAANENLPSYVVLQSGGAVPPHGGVGLFSSGYLPAQHQASILQADKPDAVPNIRPSQSLTLQRQRLDFVRQIDSQFADMARNRQVDAAIENFETAFRMQSAVPEICDISDETDATMNLYGIDDPDPAKSAYGRQALLARKLVEQGVRFVELSCLTRGIGAGGAANPWDQHGDLEKGHRAMAGQVDRPIAALIKDLEARGLLDETLIVFTGEFGRTPFSQGSNGRDHNPFGFSLWLAGGGIRGGTTYGATDELGYHAVEKPCTIYDIWATVLHQLGIDHEKLTFRSGGRDFRLTDVHGNVLNEIIA